MSEVVYADIILFDTVGISYTGNTINTQGMGGSEMQAILLLEELTKLGKKVICLNNTQKEEEINGVLYISNNSIFKYDFKCEHLIIHRTSEIPEQKIKYKNCYVWATDLNNGANLKFYDLFEKKNCKLVTLSSFQKNNYPAAWNGTVIDFIVPDWIYDYSIPANKKDFIYASSMMKGYASTIQYWSYLNFKGHLRGDRLNVCLPGYDNPTTTLKNAELRIDYHGTLTLKQTVDKIANCKGMFYVNTMPETFCLSAVFAEILKTTPYIYCVNGYGALNEVLTSPTVTTDSKKFLDFVRDGVVPENIKPNNFRANYVIDKWMKLFNNN